MTWVPVARQKRDKVKRFTKKQLTRLRLSETLRTGGQATYERATERALERQARKAEAAFKDCELR